MNNVTELRTLVRDYRQGNPQTTNTALHLKTDYAAEPFDKTGQDSQSNKSLTSGAHLRWLAHRPLPWSAKLFMQWSRNTTTITGKRTPAKNTNSASGHTRSTQPSPKATQLKGKLCFIVAVDIPVSANWQWKQHPWYSLTDSWLRKANHGSLLGYEAATKLETYQRRERTDPWSQRSIGFQQARSLFGLPPTWARTKFAIHYSIAHTHGALSL